MKKYMIANHFCNLIRLERLRFDYVSIDHILPFVCHSERLKAIQIDILRNDGDDLNLVALNEERKKQTMNFVNSDFSLFKEIEIES